MKSKQQHYPETSRIGREDVINYFNGNISNSAQGKLRQREIPRDQEVEKYHINKLHSREMEYPKQETKGRGPTNSREQRSSNTLAMAGRAQFA